ncbi:conserved hypothetical protein [Pseudomonas sp. 8Z]|uniref:hypothetical protein n=1 Tax=Pseudomonas sp. 8Z TaxID=2653166 RepID=UPI0012F1F51C|nr:hypothetical protein [Pseudomonas sp. 8Z]VXC36535.1 conserved hypothetical protein [Pseudomonas sp. 8Z]
MTHEREPLAHEQALLAHFRAHGRGEPSAELDGRILAAAREATQADAIVAKAGWAQRLRHWLLGSGSSRWSVAVAGLACIGIGLSLTWQTLPQVPQTLDTAPPSAVRSAPAPTQMTAKRAEPAQPSARQESRKAEAVARITPPAALADAPLSAASTMAPMAELVKQSEPRQDLLRLLALRKAGETQQAQRLLEQLQAHYPQLDIEVQLKHLAGERSTD